MSKKRYPRLFGILPFLGMLLLSGCNWTLLDPKGQVGIEQKNLILIATGLMLLVVVASAGISRFSGFEAGGGAVVGTLPEGLPAPVWPGWPGWQLLGQLVLPVLVITLVSFLETASSAKVDSGRSGQRWDQDQDLIGQGLAKLASGLTGAMPTSSSFSRSALNLYAGAQTAWATVFSVAVVLLALLLAMPLLHHVPLAVLAAIVVLPVWGLIKPRAFVLLWRLSRVEALIAGADMINDINALAEVCEPGTVVVFHQAQWHAAPPNLSDAVRHNVYISYCPTWMRPPRKVPTPMLYPC